MLGFYCDNCGLRFAFADDVCET